MDDISNISELLNLALQIHLQTYVEERKRFVDGEEQRQPQIWDKGLNECGDGE